MRSDMFEVIIERPRGGRYRRLKGRNAARARSFPELAPQKEPMSLGRGTKYLNENLAPLRRFLLRSVGRPWDRVYAEICERIEPRSGVQKHVLDHVREFVSTDAILIDGKPYRPLAEGPRRDRYIAISSYRANHFYVCPHSRTLREAPRAVYPAAPPNPDVRPIDDRTEVRRIRGIWYLITFEKVPQGAELREHCYDVLLKACVLEQDMLRWNGLMKQLYGRTDRYAVSKRQLSTREIRDYLGG